jgi:hypothetical protein
LGSRNIPERTEKDHQGNHCRNSKYLLGALQQTAETFLDMVTIVTQSIALGSGHGEIKYGKALHSHRKAFKKPL